MAVDLKFNFNLLTHSPDELNVQTGKLGNPADVTSKTYTEFTVKDIGKPVVMGKQGNFDLASTGDFDGFIDSIDGGPTADGMTIGGVARGQLGTRFKVYVNGAADVLDYVQSGTNAGANTENANGKEGVVAKSTTATGWRIIAFEDGEDSGTNTTAIVERI